MKIYKYDSYTIAKEESADRYIVEKDNEFYKLDKVAFDSLFEEDNLIYSHTVKDNMLYMIIMTITIIGTIVGYFFKSKFVIIDINFLYATIYLLFNIVIHELGHMLLLKLFYKNSKIKVGFKFVFIYPAFYVDTSSSYMLPKFKRTAIYLAGNFMNCLFLLIILLFFPSKLPYCYLIVTNVLVNFIPIVKSDAYYALITLFNKFNKEKGKIASIVDDTIRGFIMFALLSLLSYFS